MVMSVTQFVTYLNETFKAIWDSSAAAIEGEVTGFRISQGQWVNFDLKDDESLVSCFSVLAKMPFRLEDGMRIRAYGMPRVYQKYGKFSLSVDRFEVIGEGALKKALAALRARLDAEGFFDPARKRTLPRFPQRIALIASTESAAYGDFIRILSERWGGTEIDAYHVVVQGEKSPVSICNAFSMIQAKHEDYDVVVMTRGGGSFEELMAFQDERVVRAVYACKVPTMVAIGHERDITLAEEVADVRGSTPTDCARRLVPDRRDLAYEIAVLHERIDLAMEQHLEEMRMATERIFQASERWLDRAKFGLQERSHQINRSLDQWYGRLREQIALWSATIAAMDPTKILTRGYAIIKDAKTEKLIPRAERLRTGQPILICLQDGIVRATLAGEASEQSQLPL